MDDDGSNVEFIGHLNIGSALHPVVLRDGRVMFSTLENQGRRDDVTRVYRSTADAPASESG